MKLAHERRRREGRESKAIGQRQIKRADEHALKLSTVFKEIQSAGTTSYSGIARALNAREIKGGNGGQWTPTSVKRTLERLKKLTNEGLTPDP